MCRLPARRTAATRALLRLFGCSPNSAVCKSCRPRSPLKHVWVRTQYEGTAKNLVYSLKFGRARAASSTIAQLMSESLPYLPADTVICPVPTANVRVRQRGYDQAALLAKSIAQHSGSYTKLLARLGDTRQVGADRKTRKQQLEKAFRSLDPEKTRGAHIVLVDDIVTTGATLESAAKILKKAGAKSVNAIVFAQKQ